MRTALVSAILLVAPVSAQVVSNGNQNVSVGVNYGSINVTNNNKYVRILGPTRKALAQCADSTKKFQGSLCPGKEPTVFGACADRAAPDSPLPEIGVAQKDLYFVEFGSNGGYCAALPCPILGVDGRTILTLIPLRKSVGIKAEISAADGKMMATIDGNVVYANPNEAFHIQRDNPHTLAVIDQNNDEALWVSLENSHYIRVRGKIVTKNGTIYRFSDTELVSTNSRYPGRRISVSDSCLGRAGGTAGSLPSPPLYVFQNPFP